MRRAQTMAEAEDPHSTGRTAGCHHKAPSTGAYARGFAGARQNVPVMTTDQLEVAQLCPMSSLAPFTAPLTPILK